MIIKKAYKFRIKTTPALAEMFARYAGHCRWLWNHVLKLNAKRLQDGHRIMRYHEADYWSKLWKKSQEYGFL